jgi:orotidine-5'-phosphate decarboxylase
MAGVIKVDRSIIPACDVDVQRFEEILKETDPISKIGAYKIGASLALSVGLPRLVDIARRYTQKPLIYDHQKAGTDIPDTGQAFASMAKAAGVDAVIFFPLSGPATQVAWVRAAQDVGLAVITGGHMTHSAYVFSDGGYISDEAVDKMFENSAKEGVTNYVVPGNKPEVIRHIRELLCSHQIEPVFYAPGFITQGGTISEAASVAGSRWHAIVGRAIYEAQDIQKAAESLIDNL